MPGRRRLVRRHQARAAAGADLSEPELRRLTRRAFASYARYWIESFRLPAVPAREVERRFRVQGREHLEAARAEGRGAVLALPHMGGWELAGVWLVRQGFPLTVVVEPVRPPELFEWFLRLRRSFGFEVVPLAAGSAARVLSALRRNRMVALVCDRDLGGGGVEVEFFGETTRLPAGPATLALRARSVILPTGVYFDGDGGYAVVEPPVPCDRQGRLSEDVARITQDLASRLEGLVRRAPEQWHLFQPNWPSDPGYRG